MTEYNLMPKNQLVNEHRCKKKKGEILINTENATSYYKYCFQANVDTDRHSTNSAK